MFEHVASKRSGELFRTGKNEPEAANMVLNMGKPKMSWVEWCTTLIPGLLPIDSEASS